MARNDVYLNINALSPADAVVTGQQDMTAATVPELVLGDTPTFNFLFTDNTNVWPSWAGNAAYTLTWALSDAVAGDFAPAATTGNATPITGGWSVILPLNSYDLVGLLNTKRVGQPYPVQNLWQQLRVTDPSGNEVTRAMFWTPVRYRAISDTQNTESASPTGGRFVAVNNLNALTTPTAAQFYAANPVPTSALGSAANGELLIGNGTGFTKATLTAGDGITITNGSGSITIDASAAQEKLTATVKNAESTPITKGQVVYLFGATGNMASVKLAYNTSDATSAKTFGVVTSSSISAGGTGLVTCVGVVDGLNLGAYQDGDTVYLGATPGSITATKPYAPNHLVYVGIIERANNGNGELYVRVQNGYELDEIHDVQINAPRQSGQTLIYDNTTSLWKNARITAGGNIAVTNGDGSISIGFSGTLPVANGGTGVTTSTGSGSVVLSTSPTLTTPSIGAATGTSFNLTGSGTLGTTLTVNGTTDSSSKDTGAIITEGGLGVEKSASIGGNLTVSGTGSFSGQVTSTVNAANASNLGSFVASNATLNSFTSYSPSASLDQKYWLWQAGTAVGDGTIRLRALNDAQTNGTNALIITRTGISSTAVEVGGNLTVSGTGTSSVAGKWLVGTTIDSGALLQVGTDTTTAANGMKFGTDVSLFRSAAGVLRLASTSNYSHEIVNTAGTGAATTSYSNTGGYLFVGIDSSSGSAIGAGAYAGVISRDGAYSLVLRTNSTTALTLDSSQNAEFKGTVNVAKGAPQVKVSLDRNSSTDSAYVRYTTNGTQNWVVGTGVTGSDTNYSIYSYGGGGTALSLSYADGKATFSNSIKTAAPSGGTAGEWKLGVRVAATTTLDTTQYLQVDIGGTLYKVALVTS